MKCDTNNNSEVQTQNIGYNTRKREVIRNRERERQ